MSGARVPVVTAPTHSGHAPAVEVQCGKALPAFDVVERMTSILTALDGDDTVEIHPPAADLDVRAAAGRVHDPALLDFLENAWDDATARDDETGLIFADTFPHIGLDAPHRATPKSAAHAAAIGQYCFDTITGIGAQTHLAVTGSVTTALTGASLVLGGEQLAVALCRPPGHHVTRQVFGGGCYLNNAAIATQWLHDHGLDKVTVVDVDFHHGNGTQAIFYDRADTFYGSLHGHPDRAYPYFTGHADETGSGPGRGSTRNLPLPADVEGGTYLTLFDQLLEESVAAWAPDALVVSLGFDTFHADGSGDARLQTDDYRAIGAALAATGRPVLAVLEGGYAVPELGSNLSAWIHGATG